MTRPFPQPQDDNSPVAVQARLNLAVEMLDAAVAELRALMAQLQPPIDNPPQDTGGAR